MADEATDKDFTFDKDDFSEDDFELEESFETSPGNMNSSTFRLRNDTEALLFRFRLDIMNAYKKPQLIRDEDGDSKVIYKIKRLKGTEPLANKQGVADIVSYLENYVNGHTVQTHFLNIEDFNHVMLSIANDITCHFTTNRVAWEVSINHLDLLIGKAIKLVDIFLRRGIGNKERESYNESMKETTHREIKNEAKPSLIQKFGAWLTGGGKR